MVDAGVEPTQLVIDPHVLIATLAIAVAIAITLLLVAWLMGEAERDKHRR